MKMPTLKMMFKGLVWTLLLIAAMTIVVISCLAAVFRYQLKTALSEPGLLLSWNLNLQYEVSSFPARGKRAAKDVNKSAQIKITGLPQGVFLNSYPKPIVAKERILGISQIILINSGQLANQQGITSLQGKQHLKHILDEELMQLRDSVVFFELPMELPETQESYKERICYEYFSHCYLIDFEHERKWPRGRIIGDKCSYPKRYATGAIFNYERRWKEKYNNLWVPVVETMIKEANRKVQAYHIPGGNQSYRQVLSCSPNLYSKWWQNGGSRQEKKREFLKLIKQMLKPGTAQFKSQALPPEWDDDGEQLFFRESWRNETCDFPERVMFLNATFWEHECLYLHEVEELEFEYNISYVKSSHCNETCILYTQNSYGELYENIDYLAFPGQFSLPLCSKPIHMRKGKYVITSIFETCRRWSSEYSVHTVVEYLKTLLQVKKGTGETCKDLTCQYVYMGDFSENEATWISNITLREQGIKKMQNESDCIKRKRRSNMSKIQTAGLLLASTITEIAQISDLNSRSLAKGVYLLHDHLMTSLEAAAKDVTFLAEEVMITNLHVHFNSIRQMLQFGKIPWNILNSSWIQQELNLTDEVMNFVRGTSKALIYNIKQEVGIYSSNWEISIFYEINLPKEVYLTNWEVINMGHLIQTSNLSAKVWIKQPYTMVSQHCGELKYLELQGCQENEYLICEEIIYHQPCSNQTGSNCEVLSESVQIPYLQIIGLKDGRYLIMSSSTSCGIPKWQPFLVETDYEVSCHGQKLYPPLPKRQLISINDLQVPRLEVRLPRMIALISYLKAEPIKIVYTWDTIKQMIARAEQELLQLNLEEIPAWLQLFNSALQDISPSIADLATRVGTIFTGVLGTLINILAYAEPVILTIILILLVFLLFKTCHGFFKGKQTSTCQ